MAIRKKKMKEENWGYEERREEELWRWRKGRKEEKDEEEVESIKSRRRGRRSGEDEEERGGEGEEIVC